MEASTEWENLRNQYIAFAGIGVFDAETLELVVELPDVEHDFITFWGDFISNATLSLEELLLDEADRPDLTARILYVVGDSIYNLEKGVRLLDVSTHDPKNIMLSRDGVHFAITNPENGVCDVYRSQ